MQSENTSKTIRKTAKSKTLEAVETPQAEVKKVRATKSSPTKSSASKKSAASPKHHHSATTEKIKQSNPIALAEIPLAEALVEKSTLTTGETEIGHEDIARLAHSFWAARNYAHGSPEEDWLRAEKELAVK